MTTNNQFQIFVKLANSKLITITVHPDMLVSELKSKIMEIISKNNQFDDVFLSANAKILDKEGEKILEYGISKDQTIFVLPRLRGGEPFY